MLNKVFLMGRMVRDPELRHTANGTPVTPFTLAVERDFKGDEGKRESDFIDFVAWRGTAEFVSKYFRKGRMAIVEGRIQMRKWKDKNGNNRISAEIMADNVYFGDSKPVSDSDHNVQQNSQAGEQQYFTEMEDSGPLPWDMEDNYGRH